MRSLSRVFCRTLSCLWLALLAPSSPDASSVRTDPQSNRHAVSDVATTKRINDQYGRLPLSFEKNVGQTDTRVAFVSRGAGYSLFLSTGGEAVLALGGTTCHAGTRDAMIAGDYPRTSDAGAALRLTLVGARSKARAEGREALPGTVNYLRGRDPTGWRTGIPTYARVAYDDIYPGVDLVYYGNQRQLEYDFIVRPGADPRVVILRAEGADTLEVDASGDLVLHVGGRQVRQLKPIVYQEIQGVRHQREGRYALHDSGRVSFQLGAYDSSVPLVIDPVLVYSTYLGGGLSPGAVNFGVAISVDAAAQTYVVGSTNANDFPTVTGSFATSYRGGDFDMFVTKLDAAGALAYSTFLGGTNTDNAGNITVDAAGQAYVTGSTRSTDFPVTAGAHDTTMVGLADAFVAKLDAAGAALVYSTFLGGAATEGGVDIAVDGTGQVYVVGRTTSSDFPTTIGAFDTSFNGRAGQTDVFATKLDSTGASLVYSTFLGGDANDHASGVAIDPAGNAYVSGHTSSPDFPIPITAGAFDRSYNGGRADAFVTKIDASGATLTYSTFLGGSNVEEGADITVDQFGQAYATGQTDSIDFPTTAGAYDRILDGSDVFVARLNAAGTALGYSTLLGGSDLEGSSGVAVDGAGRAYVTGVTGSSNFPTTVGALDRSFGGMLDVFVTRLNAAGAALTYSTFLGGSGDDEASSVAVDGAGTAYLTGFTGSSEFPTTAGAHDASFGGVWDAFVTKLNTTGSQLVYSTYLGGTLQPGGDDYGLEVAVDGAGSAYVAGTTHAADFPTTIGAHDTSLGGDADAFVAKLDAAGATLAYSTYLGGSSTDSGQGLAVDASGQAYLTGETFSSDFPTTVGAYDRTHNGRNDAFIAKLDAAGAALVYSTFLGGSGADIGRSVAVDGAGHAYITGSTLMSTFPTTDGAHDTSQNGEHDVFVTKLGAAGATLAYSTFLGGDQLDEGTSIAVDQAGQAYVGGYTVSGNFPATVGAYDASFNGDVDAFVTKLNATGTTLVYSTFLGGFGSDYGRGVAIDDIGHAYVVGNTNGFDFPTTTGAHDTSWNGSYDVFVTKLNATGATLAYSTFLGGSDNDTGTGVAIDGLGQAYVTGTTASSNFPTTAGAFDTTWNYSGDVLITKLDAAGATLVYSSYLGGSGDDFGLGVAVDEAGNAYVTGITYSSGNFPTTPGAFDTSHNRARDAFVTKIGDEGPTAATVTISANGSHGPLVLRAGDPLVVAVSFDAGSAGIVDPAEVYIGVSGPRGEFWFDPATHTFVPAVTRVYAGPLASFGPVTLVNFPDASVLFGGDYSWFILVDTDTNGVPHDGPYFDRVVTRIP